MLIRPRRDADIAACAAILVRTHELDGYPRYAQHSNEAFVSSPAELNAWVAVDEADHDNKGDTDTEGDETVLGHVALHRAQGDPVYALAHAATGRPADELAVLARLAVDPRARGRGVGRRLVDHAVAAAEATGRRAVLDVVTDAPDARRLYEKAGWRRIGETVIPIPELGDLDVYVYLSPEPVSER